MLKDQTQLFDKELVELQEWVALLQSSNFGKLTEFINNRISVLNRELEKLIIDTSLDNSFKMTTILNRRDELQKLLRKFKYTLERKRKLDLEKQGRRYNNG